MQHLRLGLKLDGQRGWHLGTHSGAAVLGPKEMLNVLEMQLGLSRLKVEPLDRVAQMLGCLQACCTGQRFYEASLAVDEMGTAAALLRWRDEWLEYGWQGWLGPEANSRLQDMLAVHKLARHEVTPGMGERLQAVYTKLERRQPQIQSVHLLEPLDAWPWWWQQVLQRLPQVSMVPALMPELGAEAMAQASDLQRLQQALTAYAQGQTPTPIAWRNDGSVRVLRADTALHAAQWLAQQNQNHADALWVVPAQGDILEAAFRAAGQPHLGLSTKNRYHPALQLLPLALKVLYEPLDFSVFFQLLTHPLHPCAQTDRARLAQHLADKPGVDGPGWRQAVRECGQAGAASTPEITSERVAELEYWFASARYAGPEGVPLAVLCERTTRVVMFFSSRLFKGTAWQKQAADCGLDFSARVQKILRALVRQGRTHLSLPNLNRLLQQALDASQIQPCASATVGAAAFVNHPAAVLEPFAQVFCWPWGAEAPQPPLAWSPSERRALQHAGVHWPDEAQQARRQTESSLRPLLAAQTSLTLMLPPEAEEVHALWWLLQAIAPDLQVTPLGAMLHTPAPECSPVPVRTLPQRRRWWQLPHPEKLNWPHAQSYSSLQNLLFNPYQWVLHYPARLRRANIARVPDEINLFGRLAHAVAESWLNQPGALVWTQAQLDAWLDHSIHEHLLAEGAALLQPGQQHARMGFVETLKHGLLDLQKHLAQAGVQAVAMETSLQGNTVCGPINGRLDLALTLADGRQVIIDLKWGGKRYRQMMEKKQHYQLLLYGQLQLQHSGQWPELAYYLINSRQMLIHQHHVFPQAQCIELGDTTHASVWQQLLETWRWRQAQLQAGQIEVALPAIAADDLSTPPEQGLDAQALGSKYNPYLFLAGWEQ